MSCNICLFGPIVPQVVPLFHALAAFFRYLVCDADDAPRRRGGSALALPKPGQALATVVAHGLVGMSLGGYAWIILAADEGGWDWRQYCLGGEGWMVYGNIFFLVGGVAESRPICEVSPASSKHARTTRLPAVFSYCLVSP